MSIVVLAKTAKNDIKYIKTKTIMNRALDNNSITHKIVSIDHPIPTKKTAHYKVLASLGTMMIISLLMYLVGLSWYQQNAHTSSMPRPAKKVVILHHHMGDVQHIEEELPEARVWRDLDMHTVTQQDIQERIIWSEANQYNLHEFQQEIEQLDDCAKPSGNIATTSLLPLAPEKYIRGATLNVMKQLKIKSHTFLHISAHMIGLLSDDQAHNLTQTITKMVPEQYIALRYQGKELSQHQKLFIALRKLNTCIFLGARLVADTYDGPNWAGEISTTDSDLSNSDDA